MLCKFNFFVYPVEPCRKMDLLDAKNLKIASQKCEIIHVFSR